MRAFIALILSLAAVAAVPKNPQRIVGGSVTTINSYPEIVALLFSWGTTGHRQSCGGTIINNRSILTAAHCTIGDAPARWQSRVGSTNANSGGTVLASASIFNHPSYNSRTFDNDVSIIRTASNINFGSGIQPGNIAGSNYNLGDNQVVWAAGWGTTSPGGSLSEQLRHVQIWSVNQATCRQRYANIGLGITDNMLCSGWLDVGGRDQCQGDSGGPLYHNRNVVGVCSFGQSCALAFYPGVNARVSRYTSWIQSNARCCRSVTTINSYPEIVALLHSWGTTNHQQACGGTIINNRSILTAAHCTIGDAPARWRLRAGSTNANSGGVVYNSGSIINHPSYNSRNFDNDISIIRTTSTIVHTTVIRPASIASSNYNLADNQVVWAAGWGTTTLGVISSASEQLRHVQIWTVNQATCRERYAAAGNTVTDNMLCSGWLEVGGRDQCQGDSGGPLYHNGVVVGVCSWGRGCGQPQFPGVNARVSRFTAWIQNNA